MMRELSVLIVICALAGVVVWLWLKHGLPDLVRGAFNQVRDDFLREAKGTLQLEQQKGTNELDLRRQAVDSTVKQLEEKLDRYEKLVREFEADRDRKYGQLQQELKQVATETDRLANTTANLVGVLGNARVRGQWGQKMAEDILRLCGLQEGLHYQKEREVSAGRPDYVFKLPDDHQLFMDVKFPLDQYLKYCEAQHPEDQQRHRDAFIKSVREHLREMERRDYGASDQAVDYTIIFIPNEQVYGAVNEWMPQLIDECLQKKLIVCGPWTLYAIVRIIHQAWHNYQFSVAVRDIVRTVNGFMKDYVLFRERFQELGSQLDKVSAKYHEIAVTSTQRLESKIRRIEEYRKGQSIPEALPDPDTFTVGQITGQREDA